VAGPGASRTDDGVSILLVEDDHGDAVLVQVCLREAGVPAEAVTWVRDLREALAALAGRPDCVLLDLGLPDAQGFTAVQPMVEAAPDVAVIVLTGLQERDGTEALAAGAQDYLVKDTITGDSLARSIRYAVERKRAQKIRRQLREARITAAEQARLERGLLPTPLLRTERVSCATYYQPGRDNAVLGGDFYDVVETADGRVRAVVGDVMGHGPDEAALGVYLRVAWRTLVLAGTADEHVLPTLADLLAAEQDEQLKFATVCDVTLGDTCTVRVAGHPAPIIAVGGNARYPEVAVGPPLGVDAVHPPQWPSTELDTPPGTSVVLYTDGLLEPYESDRESPSLGLDELVAEISRYLQTGEPAGQWIGPLVGSPARAPADDTAVVVLTIAAP
jgi:serine phosphatase RsbU (regulator of sigma subunit)